MFLPDATRAVVRTIDSTDLASCRVEGLMVNTLHLSTHPGVSVIASFGGIHRFMAWSGPCASDSGGFQVFSLVHSSSKLGNVSSHGFAYRSTKGQPTRRLTPQSCIQKQFKIGADIMFCLDHCTHPNAGAQSQRESVENTILWAEKCREEFGHNLETHGFAGDGNRPLLFAVVQGGESRELRKRCAEELLHIGFDGFGFGGWPIADSGRMVDTVGYVADLLPKTYPLHALGIGKPENLIRAFDLGNCIFDTVLPTRDARHMRVFIFPDSADGLRLDDPHFYECLYLNDRKHVRDQGPIEAGCDCSCCRTYSRAYVHHLFKIGDSSAHRLATIHNLRFYTRLVQMLRERR